MSFGDLKTLPLETFLEADRAPDALCLFIHIPKTAGSSLGVEIAHTRKPYRNIHIDYRNPEIPFEEQMQAAVDRFIADAGTTPFRAASGHINWRHAEQIARQVADTRPVTFLRHPVARVISDYRYQRTPVHPPHQAFIAQHPTIESYIETPDAINRMAKHLTGRPDASAGEVLDLIERSYAFVGVVEMYRMSFNLLFDLFGHDRTPTMRLRTTESNAYNEVVESPALKARIKALNTVDLEVYWSVRNILTSRQAEWRERRATRAWAATA